MVLSASFFMLGAYDDKGTLYTDIDAHSVQYATGLPYKDVVSILEEMKKTEVFRVGTWKDSYTILPKLIRDFGLEVGCEIGVAFGTHSQNILETTDVKKLYSIDPFRHFAPSEYKDGMNFQQAYFDVLHYVVDKRLSYFGNRCELIRATSSEAIEMFEDNQLDFIYIDGNHSYESVKEDLQLYYDKIRPGGIIAGDDYGHSWHPGVKKAVDEFFAEKKIAFATHPQVKIFYWAQKPLS